MIQCQYEGKRTMDKKSAEDASSCAHCVQLQHDRDTHRCLLFDSAIVEDTHEKHCKDSIR